MIVAFFNGLALGGGLIVAIGAQNAFVLACGLRGSHVFAVATIGFLGDVALVVAGAAGVGGLVAATPWLAHGAAWGGALFLAVYGLMALSRAARPGSLGAGPADDAQSFAGATMTMLAVTFLNPHVYLDTVVLIGSVAGQYPTRGRWAFALGAALASAIWFYGLGYGARLLAPIFRRPAAWRLLDTLIALVMWAIAISLVASR